MLHDGSSQVLQIFLVVLAPLQFLAGEGQSVAPILFAHGARLVETIHHAKNISNHDGDKARTAGEQGMEQFPTKFMVVRWRIL